MQRCKQVFPGFQSALTAKAAPTAAVAACVEVKPCCAAVQYDLLVKLRQLIPHNARTTPPPSSTCQAGQCVQNPTVLSLYRKPQHELYSYSGTLSE
jgi:hypothetical protein